jgi:hypothetical protein
MMIDLLRKPPTHLRAPQRRGTFFAPLARRTALITLPRLFRRFDFLLQARYNSCFVCPNNSPHVALSLVLSPTWGLTLPSPGPGLAMFLVATATVLVAGDARCGRALDVRPGRPILRRDVPHGVRALRHGAAPEPAAVPGPRQVTVSLWTESTTAGGIQLR